MKKSKKKKNQNQNWNSVIIVSVCDYHDLNFTVLYVKWSMAWLSLELLQPSPTGSSS